MDSKQLATVDLVTLLVELFDDSPGRGFETSLVRKGMTILLNLGMFLYISLALTTIILNVSCYFFDKLSFGALPLWFVHIFCTTLNNVYMYLLLRFNSTCIITLCSC